jgi:hypothetical protein
MRARTFLSDVIKGDVLNYDAAPAMQHLLTPAGRRRLNQAERKTGAYVSIDNRTRTIAIHGTSKAQSTRKSFSVKSCHPYS